MWCLQSKGPCELAGWRELPTEQRGGDQKGPPPVPRQRAAVGSGLSPRSNSWEPEGPYSYVATRRSPGNAAPALSVTAGTIWCHLDDAGRHVGGLLGREKLGTGENLALAPPSSRAVLILGQEQVSAVAGHAAHGCSLPGALL